MKVESIILDIDGTLWNTLPLVEESWNGQMNDEGHPECNATMEDLKNLFGKTTDVIADILFASLPQEQRLPLMARCMDREHELIEASSRDCTYPGTVAALRALAKRFRLFLVSNSEPGYPELLVRKLGISDIIQDTLCFGDTGRSKGENIRTIMERNGIEKAVYVGDTQGDCDASRAAGIPFVWASYGFGQPNTYTYKIQSLSQLGELLQEDM